MHMTKPQLYKPGHTPLNKAKGGNFLWIKGHALYALDDCLIWPFCRTQSGYGHIGYEGKLWTAHRLMCQVAHGEPPTPKHVAAHECGNGHLGCVNPRHLRWKTQSENQHDRKAQGRREGGRGSRTTLSREVIEEIR